MKVASGPGKVSRYLCVPVSRGRAEPFRRPPTLLLIAGGVTASLVALPLAITVMQALNLKLQDAAALIVRPLIGTLLLNTLGLVVAASLASALIGTAAAWAVERTDLAFRDTWSVLAAAPLAIPPFISSYAWVSVSHALQDFAGALLVVTCAYYPLVYLPVAAALRGLDTTLEDMARSLGLSSRQCFFRVVLPQLRPALLGGMLLVALNTLVEFGAFALLRFRTFTTELYAQYRIGLDGPESALLALVLLAICLLCLYAEHIARGHAAYARTGAGTRRTIKPASLGWARWPAFAGLLLLTAATIGVPIGMVGYWLLQHAQAATSPVVPSPALLVSATAASVAYGLAGAAAALVLAFPIGYLATRYPGRLVTIIERTAYLGQGVPAIVIALALISVSVQFRPLYQSSILLIVTYTILFMPLALVGVRATLAQVQHRLEEAGRSLELNRWSVVRRILLPLNWNGLGAGAAIVFAAVVTELTATLLLSPIGTRTLSTQIWANTSSLAFAAAAPFAALMLALSLFSTWLLTRRFGAAALRRGV